MRGIALSTVALAAMIGGCQKAETQFPTAQAAQTDYGVMQPELYAAGGETTDPTVLTPVDDRSYESDSLTTWEPQEPVDLVRSHTVVKGDTLYKLARRFYSDQSQWKEIYDANRDLLADPHKLRVGQQLVIP